jgi:hypothetical protein
MRVQQGLVSGGTGFGHHFAQQQFATAEVGLGQNQQSSERGNVFRFAPERGHTADIGGRLKSAKTGREHMQQTTCANARLLDHLVSEAEQRWRHFETNRLCGPEVDDQLELGRLLDRKITRRFPTKDTIDV